MITAERVERGSAIADERIVRADVCIVGSGAGGAPAAAELARAGLRVVMLEEGEHVPLESLTARPRDMLPRLYRDAGQFVTVGRPPIPLPLGRAIGGTTLVNSGTCFRTPDAVLERWRRDFGLGWDLAPHFERVEEVLHVRRVPPELAGRNAAVARRGAERLGWSGGFLARNARGCVGSGVCAFGCPSGAKQHVGATYVPMAWEAGATTYTGVRARRLRAARGRVTEVEATTAGGGRLRVRADRVIVAAGTIHTPLLLRASGIGTRSGELGRNLSIHPATAVWALLDEEVDMARGVPQSYYVDEFADEGIMLEGVAGPPDYLAMAVPFTGPRHRELMLRYRNIAQFGLMVSDTSRGSVTRRLGRPIVRYDLADADTATFAKGLHRLAQLFFASGAHTVITPVARVREIHDARALEDLRLRAGELKLMAFHPLGTARAHADPDRGVVDGDLRVHGVDNLYVADGSAVPSALGVNPQVTIMALSTRLAEHLCRS